MLLAVDKKTAQEQIIKGEFHQIIYGGIPLRQLCTYAEALDPSLALDFKKNDYFLDPLIQSTIKP